jgi:hypothetical protein
VILTSFRAFAILAMLIVMLLTDRAAAVDIVVSNDKAVRINITPDVEWVDDPDPDRIALSPRTPPESGYQVCGKQHVNEQLNEAAKWYRFRIRNEASRARTMYVRLDNPRLSNVQFYSNVTNGEDTYQVSGIRVPTHLRSFPSRSPSFRLTLDPGEEGQYWLRVANRGWYTFKIELFDVNSYMTSMQRENLLLGWIYGTLGILAILSLLFFLLTWERDFLMNLMMALLALFYELVAHGTAFQFLWKDGTSWNDVVVTVSFNLVVAVALLMTWLFLRKGKLPLYWDIILPLSAWFAISISVLRALDAGLWVNRLTQYMSVFVLFAILASSLCALARGHRAARFLLLAWSLMLAGAVLMHIQWFELMPKGFASDYSMHIGIALAPLLVALALYDRIRLSREEYRLRLEAEVSQRTCELQTALDNVKTLQGLIPICAKCKRVREDSGYWRSIEHYIAQRSEADFTHGICPECIVQIYGHDVGRKVMEELQASEARKPSKP